MAARYYVALGHEQFPPDALLAQAVAADEAGFDGICCSDHLQPWWEPGHSGHAWVWLGAAGARTRRAALGTGVTAPVYRHNPVVVAQAFATLEWMNPGRVFLGIGSGESLNETPAGMEWPAPAEQLERMEEALEIITRLFAGERLTYRGRHFRTTEAILHTRPERRPPVYVSAFHPGAARVAARLGDGVWCLADPELAPGIIEVYRDECGRLGREPGEIVLQATASWGPDDDAAFAGSEVWRATLLQDLYTDDVHDPRVIRRRGREEITEEAFREGAIVSADPGEHVRRLREIEDMGATIVVVMNASGADPVGALRVYGESVLPALRGVPAGSGTAGPTGT
ncbi:MAG TPA: TIGR03557 family F420-dependent LLM class oxidoreductase [Miltoncostaeaceae bacterium]|nr:TIGR03557 family F420-dependent LLM class oxidoreductase [Miltoncostaeaceae bacterium]